MQFLPVLDKTVDYTTC